MYFEWKLASSNLWVVGLKGSQNWYNQNLIWNLFHLLQLNLPHGATRDIWEYDFGVLNTEGKNFSVSIYLLNIQQWKHQNMYEVYSKLAINTTKRQISSAEEYSEPCQIYKIGFFLLKLVIKLQLLTFSTKKLYVRCLAGFGIPLQKAFDILLCLYC